MVNQKNKINKKAPTKTVEAFLKILIA